MALKQLKTDRDIKKGVRQSVSATLYKALQSVLSITDGRSRIKWDGTSWVTVKDPTLLTVVSRHSYAEETLTLPFSDAKAVKQYIARHYDMEKTLYFVASKSKNAARVQLFKLALGKSALGPKTGCLIPETYLLANAIKSDAMGAVTSPMSSFFIYNTDNEIKSVKRTGLATDINQARMMLGVPHNKKVVNISAEQLFDLLAEGLKKSGMQCAQAFFVSRSHTAVVVDKKKLASLVGVIGLSYLIISSAYIYGTQSLRESRLAELGSDVDEVLILQNELQSKTALATQLSQLKQQSQKPVALWALLEYLDKNKSVTLDNLSSNDSENQYQLNVVASSLTDFYEQLTAQEFVNTATIASSVRRTRDGETAVITVTLKAGDA